MDSERFWDCFCGLFRVLSRAFKFGPAVLAESGHAVPESVPVACTGMVATTVMPGPKATSVLACSAIGVRIAG